MTGVRAWKKRGNGEGRDAQAGAEPLAARNVAVFSPSAAVGGVDVLVHQDDEVHHGHGLPAPRQLRLEDAGRAQHAVRAGDGMNGPSVVPAHCRQGAAPGGGEAGGGDELAPVHAGLDLLQALGHDLLRVRLLHPLHQPLDLLVAHGLQVDFARVRALAHRVVEGAVGVGVDEVAEGELDPAGDLDLLGLRGELLRERQVRLIVGGHRLNRQPEARSERCVAAFSRSGPLATDL